MAALSIRAPIGGRLVLPESKDLKERFVNQGEILGYVVEQGPMKVRVAVRQDDVGLVREYMSDVRVQLADRLGASIPAAVLREVPGGTNVLPSAVLGKSGGGKLDVDPRDPDQRQTFIRVFEYVLELPADLPRSPAGTRAYVRFGHGSAPLGVQWYRKARQVFLGQFGF